MEIRVTYFFHVYGLAGDYFTGDLEKALAEFDRQKDVAGDSRLAIEIHLHPDDVNPEIEDTLLVYKESSDG